MALTKAQLIDLNNSELTLDLDADTSITADTDDQIDIKIAGADDFRFTANTFTALSGSGVVIPDGGPYSRKYCRHFNCRRIKSIDDKDVTHLAVPGN